MAQGRIIEKTSKFQVPYDRNRGILILKSLTDNMIPAENFLRHRGWSVFSTSDLRQASQILVQKEPAYVFVSVDHPNPKAKILTKIIKDGFPIHIISFAENSYASSTQKLHHIETKYKLYAPISGPGLERMILGIRKEVEGDLDLPKSSSLKQIQKSSLFPLPSKSRDKSGLIIQDRAKRALGHFQFKTLAPLTPEGQDPLQVHPPEESASKLLEIVKPDDEAGAVLFFEQAHNSNLDETEVPLPETNIPLAKNPPLFTKKSIHREWEEAEERYEFTETVDKGLQEGADQEPIRITQPLGEVSEVACFEIISAGLNGYLVIASATADFLSGQIVKRVADRLNSFLRKRSQGLSDSEQMRFQIHPVPFTPWAQSYSIMMQKSIHSGSEIVGAFFPRAENEFEFDIGPQNMIEVSLQDIETSRPVNFDLYLFLEKNQKMIRYTPQGGTLMNSQKLRLIEKGVNHFYVDPHERFELRKYRAQAVLDHRIDNFLSDKDV
ncbi:MAG: hypothetical protein AB7O96_16280 [Pseudobdellovibrionaceae bacterium]